MRRHLPAKLLLAFVLLVIGVGVAVAQYRGYNGYTPQWPRSLKDEIAQRIFIDVAAAAIGFLVGRFFQPPAPSASAFSSSSRSSSPGGPMAGSVQRLRRI